jgi:hypothetical protein
MKWLACVASLIAVSASAQPASSRAAGAILGIVEDVTARPIAGAAVSFGGYQLRATTDSLGRFRFVNVPPGRFMMIVRGIGFRPAVNEIGVRSNDTLRLTFSLQPTTQEMPTVLVRERTLSPRLQEFEDRRKRGLGGEFFNRAEIEAMRAIHVGDVLRRTKSVKVKENDLGAVALSAREFPPEKCPLSIYVDDVPLGSVNLKDLPSPNLIAAIEVYGGSATLPIWLPNGPMGPGRKGCGAILIWTRDGSG